MNSPTTPFAFVGKIAASKSLLNRALVAQSYFPELHLLGESSADDVLLMREALQALREGREMWAGAAGTVLRFMALKASRIPGQHILGGEPRLFERPQEELIKILRQLGVRAEISGPTLTIHSEGWKLQGDTLLVPTARSSQFATSVLFNAWDLPFDLYVSLGAQRVSEGYWRMSVKLAQQLGMRLDFWDSDFRVPRGQKVHLKELPIEIDMSSAFAVAAVAAVSGQATLLDFPDKSVQPDAAFTEILSRMGVPLKHEPGTLKVSRAPRLNGVAVNLSSTPDLFPVLAALCGLAEGDSDLYGAPHLIHKESNRLQHMADWLRRAGREVQVKEDGLTIRGSIQRPESAIAFDPQGDHRLAFAAAVFMAAGWPATLNQPQVVSKSFPEFWSVLGWHQLVSQ